jgi:polyisoprenoid-binding protein YceI
MRRLLATLLFASVLATPASAAGWSVEYAKSRLGFAVQWSNEPFSAAFKSWKADIDFDPADLAHARAAVTIDMVSQFPTAQFLATHFTHKSGNDYVATGTLTIRGVTKPVTLPFTLVISGKTARATGTAQIMRLDFNVGEGEWAGEKPVAHAVTVTIDLTATRS